MNKKKRQIVLDGIFFVLSFFLLGICYNLFFVPNELVIGGLSGLSIIVNKVFNLTPSTFILITNIFLLTISFILIGKEKTFNSVLGSILYPVMIAITLPIVNTIIPYFQFNDFRIIVIFSALLNGVSMGLIFKYGFTTGGTDILVQIISKYIKIPEGRAILAINSIIIFIASLTFGITKAFYAIVVLFLSSMIFDKVLFEQSNSKVFYIYTKKTKEVKKVILKEFKTGFTIMPTVGGYSHKKGELIMSVLPNRYYYSFKSRILDVDPDAFFVINDCYESQGGYRKKNIPFL